MFLPWRSNGRKEKLTVRNKLAESKQCRFFLNFSFACCVLRVACCVLRVACCVLRVARCVLRVACCVMRDACFVQRFQFNTLRVRRVVAF